MFAIPESYSHSTELAAEVGPVSTPLRQAFDVHVQRLNICKTGKARQTAVTAASLRPFCISPRLPSDCLVMLPLTSSLCALTGQEGLGRPTQGGAEHPGDGAEPKE